MYLAVMTLILGTLHLVSKEFGVKHAGVLTVMTLKTCTGNIELQAKLS